EPKLVVRDVRRAQLIRLAGARRLVLTHMDREIEDSILEAAIARSVQPNGETQLERRTARPAVDDELGADVFGHRQIALPTQLEWRERDLLFVPVLLAGTELGLSQVERGHGEPGERRRPFRVCARTSDARKARSGFPRRSRAWRVRYVRDLRERPSAALQPLRSRRSS